jgi:large subunit ribosomal protein LX
MVVVKQFRVIGQVKKWLTTIPFTIELKATKPEEVVEKVYADIGSRHKARRFEIKISKIEEIQPSEKAETEA